MSNQNKDTKPPRHKVIRDQSQEEFLRFISSTGLYDIEPKISIRNIRDKCGRVVGYINSSITSAGGLVGYSFNYQNKVRKGDKPAIRVFFEKYSAEEGKDWGWYSPGGKRTNEEYIVIKNWDLAQKVFGPEDENIVRYYYQYDVLQNDAEISGIAYLCSAVKKKLPDRLTLDLIIRSKGGSPTHVR